MIIFTYVQFDNCMSSHAINRLLCLIHCGLTALVFLRATAVEVVWL